MRLLFYDDMSTVVDGEVLRQNFDEMRRTAVKINIQPFIVRRGHIDTSKGLVFKSKSALKAANKKEAACSFKRYGESSD